MTALEIYRARYEAEQMLLGKEYTKYEWAASNIFDLVTYDGSLDEYFVDTIIEVCKVIFERRNFEYIENQNRYLKYIIVCQLLNKFRWIDWGTSIRGAWFEVDIYHDWLTKTNTVHSKNILDSLEWTDDENHVIDSVPFTPENLKALIEFLEE